MLCPNVMGTYLMCGTLKGDHNMYTHPHAVYVGQAASPQPFQAAVGIRRRMIEHKKDIARATLTSSHNSKVLYVHRQLSRPEIVKVEFAVLSVFPFPKQEWGDAVLRHYTFLLTLMETVDVLLMSSLKNEETDETGRFRGGQQWKLLRPLNSASRAYHGLNLALPSLQRNQRLGTLALNIDWSSQEILSFINLVNEQHKQVYIHDGPGGGKIQWDYLISNLAKVGVCKTRAQGRAIYRVLWANPDSGLMTQTSSRWQFIWTHVHGIKRHLTQKGLIREPRDENDLFYRIPALEDGLDTIWQIRCLLKRTGYADVGHTIFYTRFFPRFIPRLLQRDIWERIRGKQLVPNI